MKNALKTISVSLDQENFDNTYGWTAVLSKRPSRLFAYTKDFTSGYYLDKSQFNQAIKEASTDFEYYHEIKEKLDQSKCWEALELPVLESPKHHYNPTRFVILRRDRDSGDSCSRRINVRRR